MKIIDDICRSVYSFSDTAYKEGWILYAIVGIAFLFLLIMIS